jgi:hypothetical protein
MLVLTDTLYWFIKSVTTQLFESYISNTVLYFQTKEHGKIKYFKNISYVYLLVIDNHLVF